MILEVAILQVIPGEEQNFEKSFAQASAIISGMKGYIQHELHKCMEEANKYILLVKWETLTDHTVGFRESPEYQEWKALLHHYYDPFPTVEHYELLYKSA
ncbi:hypothetical protein J23TS9_23080 [Paenibacillus sp. J23TS9]|uniref:antibiotic biosynthesis monooxygenase family protein n=1 Tax=Paenibacillus sp. J23TS9 TaxID=2807193 RepID=UPI001B0F6CDB|nr:antibiotic biosynthesis monooxygenase [Paenibacillus sp. J23TS9]GIP27178.1 hypothetical protein J23TS9_23080 [Paenibacillus sp. J23TS9]